MGKVERPVILTVLGWFLVITGILGSLALALAAQTPRFKEALEATGTSYSMAIGWGIGAPLISAVAGAGILSGRNWGRILFALYTLATPVVRYLLYGASAFDAGSNLRLGQLVRLVVSIVLVVIMFVPPVSGYFQKREIKDEQQ